MSASVQTLASVLSTDANYYAGDPHLLKAEYYAEKVNKMLQSDRSDLLVARVAIHAQLKEAFKDPGTQEKLKPFMKADETFDLYIQNAKARSRFFSTKQLEMRTVVIESPEQAALKEAHGWLAAWESENAVLLHHPMFMSHPPSQALLLESAATIALYREYASIEENEANSESSSGDIPAQLIKNGARPLFTETDKTFAVDKDTKMFSQHVLQNKRVEYEEKRELVTQRRKQLQASEPLQKLQSFIEIRNEIFQQFGIDRLVSLRSRKDKELGEPMEGGEDETVKQLSRNDELIKARHVAQYSIPKIIEQCHKNYLNMITMDDWDTLLKNGDNARDILRKNKPLKNLELFRYWFLSCITADLPQQGPNKIVGNKATVLEDYKKFWSPQKSSYLPSMNTANRQNFPKLAEKQGLPHIVVLSPVTYSYRQHNDPSNVTHGELDMMVYDMTQEKVLLMIDNSSDDRRPRHAFIKAQEERYRLAAVVRTALANDNEMHDFQCKGTVAEYFFDPEFGCQEEYFCIMAPLRINQKAPINIDVPMSALRPFSTCPPRYFVLGSNWGVSSGIPQNPYPMSFAYMSLNDEAIALQPLVPDGFVTKNILPKLITREEGKERDRELRLQQQREQSKLGTPSATPRRSTVQTPRVPSSARTPRTSVVSTTSADGNGEEEKMMPEEEDPLATNIDADVLRPLCDLLTLQSSTTKIKSLVSSSLSYLKSRQGNDFVKQLPAVKDGVLRTPLNVFLSLREEMCPMDEADVSKSKSASMSRSHMSLDRSGKADKTTNVAWF